MRRKMKGFTLIEIIIVIAIIGILIAISVPKFVEASRSAMNKRIEMNSRSIIIGVQAFIADKAHPPSTSEINDIINNLDVNRTGITYIASIHDFGIKVQYESNLEKYSGFAGYRTEPNTEADVDNITNLNDGSEIDRAWFVYRMK